MNNNEASLVSIIIPYYNKWDLTHARLMDLYKFAPDYCEIILIDDASPDTDCQTGVAWWQKHPSRHKIRYYRNPENLGFGGSHNNGAKLANGKILVFLSNDVIIYGKFIEDIVAAVQSSEKVLACGRIVWWAAGWNQFKDKNGKEFIIPYAEGYLLACTKENWKELGGFDPRYGKFDYEDIDISTTALYKGYEILALNTNMLKHISGASIMALGIDRMAITTKNKEIFIQKWQEKFEDIFNKIEASKS